ncbi:MAG: transcriptional repressor [Bacteroidales bacterium]|nr:transcriptional repressor [Bacteroidales bacterium]
MRNKKAPDIEQFKKILRNEDMKATQQRIAVHQAMLELGHASADMVCDYISAHNGTDITVASVYNILSQLNEIGLYKRRFSSNNKMYFDVNNFNHLHLYDTKFNEYKDVQDDELIELIENHFRGRRFRGYKIDDFEVQIVCHSTRRPKKD